MSYATVADVVARYPAEATVLAADETTRERDDERIAAALVDVTAEIRVILGARYSRAELDRLDEESLGALRIFAIDMALYRVALSMGRSNERVKERYEIAVKRLEGIAAGRGALTTVDEGAGGGSGGPETGPIAPNEALVVAPERMFTRGRLRGLG